MYTLVNNNLIDETTACITPLTAGFQYGYGVFETIKVSHGRVVFLKEHFNRLAEGLKVLELPLNQNFASIEAQCDQLIQANNLDNGFMKIICTRGVRNKTEWLMLTGIKHYATARELGFKVCMASATRNESSRLNSIKSLNYLENSLQKDRANREFFDEAIFLNTKGHVCEGTIANIFWFKDDQLLTPAVECGLLPGITRQKVLEVCARLRMNVQVGAFALDELRDADAIFLTNSLMDIMPVSQFEDRHFALHSDDETHQLIQHFQEQFSGQSSWKWDASLMSASV
jgi:aminodeoxychorismate lyase